MNSFELIPTEENLIHTLDKDLLKRNKDLVRFYDLILVQEGASSIAIDGRWGSGKTFFVKQSMLLINAKNPMSDMDDEKKASIVYALPFPKKQKTCQRIMMWQFIMTHGKMIMVQTRYCLWCTK